MLNFITVATASYYAEAARLARSLRRTQPEHRLRIYCDDAEAFRHLARETGCAPVAIPELRRFGGFRAKPMAWAQAVQDGDFLYLDADIIALESLAAAFPADRLSACPDPAPLAAGWGERPWPQAPDILCRVYVNSGVMHVPAGCQALLAELDGLARDDAAWSRLRIRFNDQDLLNAVINRRAHPVHLLDPKTWNFDGFLSGQLYQNWRQGFRGPIPPEGLRVERIGGHLCNRMDGSVLRLVHLAGIPQRSAFLGLLPEDIRDLLERLTL